MEYYSTIKRVKYWSLVVKNPPANVGDVRVVGSIPGSGRSPGGGHGNPLQYFCLKNPHGQRNLEGYNPWCRKELDTMSDQAQVTVVKNPPAPAGDVRDEGSIPGSGRFPWRRKWQPTPVFLPGESCGQRSLVDYNP